MGLYFSALGDIALEFNSYKKGGEKSFILGLILFLIGHVCYIFSFKRNY